MDYGNFHVESSEALAPGSTRLVSGAEGVAVRDACNIRNGVGRLLAYEDGSGSLGDAERMLHREPAKRAEGVEEVGFGG